MKLSSSRITFLLGAALLFGAIAPSISYATDPEFHEKAQRTAHPAAPAAAPDARARLGSAARIERVIKPGLTVLNTAQLAGQRIAETPGATIRILSGKEAIAISENTTVERATR